MPRLDLYHEVVRHALEKDGWRITDDPLQIEYKDLRVFVDLGAEKVIAAEREGRSIAVEVKVFGGISLVNDFEKALGQYNLYRSLLNLTQAEKELFLAVADEIYQQFFQREAISEIVAQQGVKLLVFSPGSEEVVRWIS